MNHLKVVLKPAGMQGVEIVDADTGLAIDNVRGIAIRAGVDEATRVTLELIGLEVEGDVTVLGDDVTRVSNRQESAPGSSPAAPAEREGSRRLCALERRVLLLEAMFRRLPAEYQTIGL